MSYCKRGLVYCSGFEFDFAAHYVVSNPKSYPIDAVFVFPVQSQSNRILLSELEFLVAGEQEALPLDVSTDKLVWTGRRNVGESKEFDISFRGHGLDRFTYVMDPALVVRIFSLSVDISGGANFDYEFGIVPAHEVENTDDSVTLKCSFESLESGVPVGVSLQVDTTTRELTLQVSPSKAGAEGGSLELVFVSPNNEYFLSGELAPPLPTTSWRINELFVNTHLLSVFDYTWAGGSLSPAPAARDGHFSSDIPIPGKRASYRQFLLHTSPPTLTLNYDVSLEDNYFKVVQ